MRILLCLCLLIATLRATATPLHADAPCHEFDSVQQIILAEGAYQPLDAKIEMARVIVTHGPCDVSASFYSAYGLAQWVHETEPSHCIGVWVCRSFYMLYTISPDVRESAAVAAWVALNEFPRVRRYHWDSSDAPLWWWWSSPIACPHSWWVVGTLRFC